MLQPHPQIVLAHGLDFEAVLEELRDAVVVVDAALSVQYVNRSASALFDAEEPPQTLAELLATSGADDSGAALLQAAARVASSAEPHPTEELLLRHASGLQRSLHVRLRRAGASTVIELSPRAAEHAMEERRREAQARGVRYHAAMDSLVRNPAVRDGRMADAVVHVTRSLSQTLNVARVSLWWFVQDSEGSPQRLESVDVYEHRDDRHSVGLSMEVGDYPRYFRALASGDVIAAEFAQSDARTREFTESYLVPIGITSLLDVPVLSGGRVVGVLCHEHIGPARAWSLEEQQFASFAANVVCLARETADHKAAQREAEQSRLFLDSVVENLPLMVFVKDAESLRFVRFNRAGEQLLGLDRAELLGRSDADLFAPEQAEAFMRRDREALASQVPVEIPAEPIHSRTLGPRVLHTRKIALRDADGTPRYLLGISEDVTDRHRP